MTKTEIVNMIENINKKKTAVEEVESVIAVEYFKTKGAKLGTTVDDALTHLLSSSYKSVRERAQGMADDRAAATADYEQTLELFVNSIAK